MCGFLKWLKFLISLLSIVVVCMNANAYAQNDLSCRDCNVIIISLTNLRFSPAKNQSYINSVTPNIDKFNEKALVFNNAFSTASWTRPAGASLFTSLYPAAHGVDVKGERIIPLDKKIPTLAEILHQSGYVTASFNGGADYSFLNGFDHGFTIYKSYGLHKTVSPQYGRLAKTMPPAIRWLEKNKDKKFFLFLQSFDLHCPFMPPEPYRTKYDPDYHNEAIDFNICFNSFKSQSARIIEGVKYYAVVPIETFGMRKNVRYQNRQKIWISERDVEHIKSLYDGEMNYVDYMLGQFFKRLEELGLYQNSIVIVLSEHGEIIGKKGRLMKGGPIRGTFYDDIIHFPLSIRHPKMKEGRKIQGLVSIIDIMPTLLDFLNFSFDEHQFQGKSLVPLITKNYKVNPFVYGGTTHYGFFGKYKGLFPEISSVSFIRSEKWKLIKEQTFLDVDKKNIKDVKYELYDLKKDPEELDNVSTIKPKIKNKLLKKLNRWEKNVSREANDRFAVPLPTDFKKEMRKRGYW